MIKLSGLMNFDISDSDDGMAISIWLQGCPHRCKGCHNPETWDFNGGYNLQDEIFKSQIYDAMKTLYNKCNRVNISILGGEPLCSENIIYTRKIIEIVKNLGIPINKIYLWTGYYYKTELKKISKSNKDLKYILKNIDILIDGRFELDKRDTSLKLRGSSNQNIYKRKYYFFNMISKLILDNN